MTVTNVKYDYSVQCAQRKLPFLPAGVDGWLADVHRLRVRYKKLQLCASEQFIAAHYTALYAT